MEVIMIEHNSFYQLIEEVVKRIKEKETITEDRWISSEEAMKKLRITSPTTLYKLRVNGLIKYSNPLPKLILYDTASIDTYLEKHSKNTF
jgi:hypothetical protein